MEAVPAVPVVAVSEVYEAEAVRVKPSDPISPAVTPYSVPVKVTLAVAWKGVSVGE